MLANVGKCWQIFDFLFLVGQSKRQSETAENPFISCKTPHSSDHVLLAIWFDLRKSIVEASRAV